MYTRTYTYTLSYTHTHMQMPYVELIHDGSDGVDGDRWVDGGWWMVGGGWWLVGHIYTHIHMLYVELVHDGSDGVNGIHGNVRSMDGPVDGLLLGGTGICTHAHMFDSDGGARDLVRQGVIDKFTSIGRNICAPVASSAFLLGGIVSTNTTAYKTSTAILQSLLNGFNLLFRLHCFQALFPPPALSGAKEKNQGKLSFMIHIWCLRIPESHI